MLNISPHNRNIKDLASQHSALSRFDKAYKRNLLPRIGMILGALVVIVLIIPWTQTINSKGIVTALRPDQRPQTIHSVIAGRIEEWHVQEGDLVEKGDTILFLSEVKDEYFDPNLLERTNTQLKSKELTVKAYDEKIKAQESQITALVEMQGLKISQAENKLKQARLKVQSDSIDLEAYITSLHIAEQQLKRVQNLYDQGLKSLTDFEKRQLSAQKALAEKISGENKLLASRNELLNAQIELGSIKSKFANDIAKAQSNRYSAESDKFNAEVDLAKLRSQYTNYEVRSGMYYVLAPQRGYITRAMQNGLGETIKEGDEIVSIMPSDYQLAVEMFIRPIDLPLVQKEQTVRIQFDGWPAIVFSGWPGVSHGTYAGRVVAIDNFANNQGLYRLLVAPDPTDYPWPTALRLGAGTRNMVLLNDVPVWYELWRKINGFPPDFYQTSTQQKLAKK